MITHHGPGRAFVDTNVLLYTVIPDWRSPAAERAAEQARVISVQVLNEFANTARRKLGWGSAAIRAAESRFVALFEVVPLTLATHDRALSICDRYGFSLYDSLIVAAALDAGCDLLFSEDLQHGQRIDQALEVVNPFR